MGCTDLRRFYILEYVLYSSIIHGVHKPQSIHYSKISYCVKQNHRDSKNSLKLTSSKRSSFFFIGNIPVTFHGCIFQQTVPPPPPFSPPCSYEAYFMQRLRKTFEKKLVRSFNLTFRFIDDVFSLSH